MSNSPAREIWVDWMRVTACLMVMVVHGTEPFYLGGEGAQLLSRADVWWVGIFDALARCAVPLFLVASSYLQFPVKYSTGEFFRRRALRILPPFVLWSVFYALWVGEPVENLRSLLLNFNYAAGHLWFVYMIIGLYLIMPLLSPWAEKVGRVELRWWIGLWLLTTFVPALRYFASGGEVSVVYGPTGIPQTAKYPLWGEASWNGFGLLYYISGLAGYLLLGLYLRKFGPQWSIGKTVLVAVPCFLAGFAISAGFFVWQAMADSSGVFPYNGTLVQAVNWETMLCNDTIGVALMTVGLLLLFRCVRADGVFYRRVVLPVSKASYGMYLMHMVFLAVFAGWFRSLLYVPDVPLGWTTPVVILLTAVSSFVTCAVLSVLLQKIPKAGKWIVG